MANKERILVVSPHCDDESFGCLGTLLKHKDAGAEFAFLWFTHARDTKLSADKITDYFEAEHWRFMDLKDQHLDRYPLVSLMKPIEEMVQAFKPTIAYIPFIADLNKDHRLVSEAAMVACRPYKKRSPKEVWMYQIPGTTELGLRTFHTDRTEVIDAKQKRGLIKTWYPGELINGRSEVKAYERFERWPLC